MLLRCGIWFVLVLVVPLAASAQETPGGTVPPGGQPTEQSAPAKVEVQPEARDPEIRQRVLRILQATGWFQDPEVTVNEGVVFLSGDTDREKYREWAGNLARNTRDVVAVVNRIEVVGPALWALLAWEELSQLVRNAVQALPLLLWSIIVLVLAWVVARLTAQGFRKFIAGGWRSRLLREAAARGLGILIFLLGVYLVLRVVGLTRLAVTVLGGTGLIGLTLGIAFRDITENFLASLFLSLQNPFRDGDLVEVGGTLGYVQRLTSRTTVLMTLDGNQVQIPNATVFKSAIRNYTSNPNRREDFLVGIGYDAAVPRAQEVALQVLAEHPAVLKQPEPWVLVDNLGAATVNLKVYFWLDGRQHSWLKVRSSVIRLVKRSLQDAGISLPDEAREVVFPRGVPVHVLTTENGHPESPLQRPPVTEPEVVTTAAEGELRSQAGEIEQQARQSWSPDHGENLLNSTQFRARGTQQNQEP